MPEKVKDQNRKGEMEEAIAQTMEVVSCPHCGHLMEKHQFTPSEVVRCFGCKRRFCVAGVRA